MLVVVRDRCISTNITMHVKAELKKYLTINIKLKYTIVILKFRHSILRLNIELGKYNNSPKENRICNFCQQSNNANVIDCE